MLVEIPGVQKGFVGINEVCGRLRSDLSVMRPDLDGLVSENLGQASTTRPTKTQTTQGAFSCQVPS
jgi:hypothetical protein